MSLADRLLAARADGDPFPDWLIGTVDLDEALELQLAVLDDHIANGASLGGWKVGLTSQASRDALGSDTRPFGFVLADRVLDSPATIPDGSIRGLRIEPEMCFTVGSDIASTTVAPAEVFNHIETVHAAFELNESRIGSTRPDFSALVTDCLTNWGIVVGPGVPVTAIDDIDATRVAMSRNGEVVFAGVSRDHLDDHAVSLCALVETLGRHGRRLRAGERVITGAFARFDAAAGDRWSATYTGVGSVDLTII